ncbi:MAG: hypothetical protein FWD04_07900 [Conexibacteraceae bacterium]|nr:hypothetical protein [Conexibacteraceae bacterium]
MPDQLEEHLRDAFSYRAAQLDPDSIARLSAIDYRPRRRRIRRAPAFGALGLTGAAAAAAGVIVALGSSAAPAFAGWQATPTKPAPSQVSRAIQNCGQNMGSPVLTDSRGPYTAAIYDNGNTSSVCLGGNGISMSSTSTSATPVSVAPGQIQAGGGGQRDSAGNALTLADGHIGAGVTAVTIDLSDGSSVQATVSNGWYMAWWPGSVTAAKAEVTTASGTNTITFPSAPAMTCPSGSSNCSVGYGYGGGPGAGVRQNATQSDSVTQGRAHGSSGSANSPSK